MEVNARWRTNIIPDAVESDPHKVVYMNGRWMPQLNVTFKPEDYERIRVGRACVKCWVGFEEAWPDKCPTCGFLVKHYQPQVLEEEFEGYKFIGPSTGLQEELDRLDDWSEREVWNEGSQIYIPAGVKL